MIELSVTGTIIMTKEVSGCNRVISYYSLGLYGDSRMRFLAGKSHINKLVTHYWNKYWFSFYQSIQDEHVVFLFQINDIDIVAIRKLWNYNLTSNYF